MPFLIFIAIVMICSWQFPRATVVLITGPLVGTALGGFSWGLAAMFSKSLISWEAFGAFIIGGIAVTIAYFLRDYKN